MTKPALDATDHRLLNLLRENARAPVAELARNLGLSRTTVQSRIERLERNRLVTGYTVKVPAQAEGGLVWTCMMITAAPKKTQVIEAALRRIPEVRTLHSVSGSFDLLAVVAAGSIRDLDALIDRIGLLEGVEHTRSAIVLSTRIDR